MSSNRCGAELCANWTGDGCVCAVLGIESACGPCDIAGDHDACETLRQSHTCCCGRAEDPYDAD